MKPSSVGHHPAGPWAFDKSVTRVFDDMIERSIPQYSVMRELIASLALRNGAVGGTVLDLGCSTGISISALALHAHRLVGVEISESMLEAVRQRFVSYSNIEILEVDLRTAFPSVVDVDVVLAVFTLQFVPVEHRRRVVANAFRALKSGGVMIVAEKIIGESPENQDSFVDLYHGFKLAQGYSQEDVERKALSLEGRLVACTERENVSMFENAGFRSVECVWRWVNFGAWIARRP